MKYDLTAAFVRVGEFSHLSATIVTRCTSMTFFALPSRAQWMTFLQIILGISNVRKIVTNASTTTLRPMLHNAFVPALTNKYF